jgi:flagellar protein FliS
MAAASSNAYLRTKVLTASPAELRLMLLDGAVRFGEQARQALEKSDFEGVYNNGTRCQNIVIELMNSLRPEHDPELCKRLSALYAYIYSLLVKAGSERKVSMYAEAVQLLKFERDTWSMLIDQLTAENRAAQSMTTTPDIQPPLGVPPAGPADTLVGATVSLKG